MLCYVGAHSWRSEDNLVALVLFFHFFMVLGDQTWSSGFAESAFTMETLCWPRKYGNFDVVTPQYIHLSKHHAVVNIHKGKGLLP